MNRNNEAHFLNVPQLNISRSRFNRSQDIKLTFDAGELIPFYVDEVLPGDTFSVDQAAIIRMTTPKYPVMDNAYIDFYYFFVPNRIIWDHWKEFMGENNTGPWEQTVEYTVPALKIEGGTGSNRPFPDEGSILDYMGIPAKMTKTTGEKTKIKINALPIRAYVKIWNEWFRDQNVDNPAVNYTDDADQEYTAGGPDKTEITIEQKLKWAAHGGYPLPVNRYHDYFSSTLPSPQKGPSVTLPMTGDAPIRFGDGNYYYYTDGYKTLSGIKGNNNASNPKDIGKVDVMINGQFNQEGGTEPKPSPNSMGMYADLRQVQAATINQLRQAFQVQKYYEECARGGTRYREIIRSLFGTTISDKTVQIPEYLGGQRVPININQVIQTSQTTETSPQGNTGAMSVTTMNKSQFTKSFEEHGWVLGLCCVRHDHTYQQGIERMWFRKDKLDYYYPVFANLGEQAVLKRELYATGETSNDESVFGYQEAWAEYRMKPNRVAGKFRSNAAGTLDVWHYADNYSATPNLSQEWMKEGKNEIARTLLIQDEPQFIMDVLVSNVSTRPMPIYSVPGLIDHH
jgi:hypothetical protein